MAAASYWRVKGLSYLQYLSIGSNVVRNALKEPLKTEALKRSKVHYAMSAWADGTQGPVEILDVFRSYSATASEGGGK